MSKFQNRENMQNMDMNCDFDIKNGPNKGLKTVQNPSVLAGSTQSGQYQTPVAVDNLNNLYLLLLALNSIRLLVFFIAIIAHLYTNCLD